MKPVGGTIMRNFNSPNHGSNLQHITHQAKTNLIKSVVTGEPTKLLRRRSNCTLGNTKSKCSRRILTTCISVVLNNFMKKRLINCASILYSSKDHRKIYILYSPKMHEQLRPSYNANAEDKTYKRWSNELLQFFELTYEPAQYPL